MNAEHIGPGTYVLRPRPKEMEGPPRFLEVLSQYTLSRPSERKRYFM